MERYTQEGVQIASTLKERTDSLPQNSCEREESCSEPPSPLSCVRNLNPDLSEQDSDSSEANRSLIAQVYTKQYRVRIAVMSSSGTNAEFAGFVQITKRVVSNLFSCFDLGIDDEIPNGSYDDDDDQQSEDEDDLRARYKKAALLRTEEQKMDELQNTLQKELVVYVREILWKKMKFAQEDFMAWGAAVSKNVMKYVRTLEDMDAAVVEEMWHNWIRNYIQSVLNERRSNTSQAIFKNLRESTCTCLIFVAWNSVSAR